MIRVVPALPAKKHPASQHVSPNRPNSSSWLWERHLMQNAHHEIYELRISICYMCRLRAMHWNWSYNIKLKYYTIPSVHQAPFHDSACYHLRLCCQMIQIYPDAARQRRTGLQQLLSHLNRLLCQWVLAACEHFPGPIGLHTTWISGSGGSSNPTSGISIRVQSD